MIKAISYWSLKNGLSGTHPIQDALATAKAEGFKGLELCIGPEGVLTPTTSQAECEAIRRTIDQSGITVQTLASGMSWGLNPTSDDPKIRAQAVELHAAALQRAAWLQCDGLLFVPGVVKSPISPDVIRYDVALQRARDAVGKLLEVAEKVQVDLCIENVWNGFLLSPLELAQFVDSFQCDRLGVYFDVGNGLGYHQHPPHWIELLGKRIKRVHIKDFKENFDWLGAYSFCNLLEGQVPWAQVMEALRSIGYDKTLVAEMLPWDPGILGRTSSALDRILEM